VRRLLGQVHAGTLAIAPDQPATSIRTGWL
jgi:hypothetical protein